MWSLLLDMKFVVIFKIKINKMKKTLLKNLFESEFASSITLLQLRLLNYIVKQLYQFCIDPIQHTILLRF